MWETLQDWWPVFVPVITLILAAWAVAHALLHKREERAVIGWVGVIVLVPLLGALLYWVLGINRIQRRARVTKRPPGVAESLPSDWRLAPRPVGHLTPLQRLGEAVTGLPAVGGNEVQLLAGGDVAYGAMIDAIEGAERTVSLTSYIFDADRAGTRFADALERAADRGVEVRVLVDAVGARYSSPSIVRVLARRGVPAARFMPTRLPWRLHYANLRSHRKLLVVDGRVAFTGGMNIREGCMESLWPTTAHPFVDVHARVRGPVVHELQQVWARDWAFATGERLEDEAWFPPLGAVGEVTARAVPDGPDDDFDKLRLVLLGAIAAARERVAIVTPYFLPDAALITALNVAALRGVTVDIVVPADNNQWLVEWASTAPLQQVLRRGCRVHHSPPPFDHTKLMVVDEAWTLIGSGNWDPRSLRLNFELNVECYDPAVAADALAIVDARIAHGRRVTREELLSRPLRLQIRDGLARLLTPYL